MSKNIFGTCLRCGEFKRLTRDYCATKCYSYLIKNNLINRLPKQESPETLTRIQEEILIGSMLGDGCIFKNKPSVYPYFTITRKIEDISYLKYEFEFFKDFCNHKEVKLTNIFDKRTNRFYQQCKFVTRSAKTFLKYYHQWYCKGYKALPDNLKLTPLICAIWFCDDGCVIKRTNTKRINLKLSTHCFTEIENLLLVNYLSNLLNDYFTIGHDNGKCFIISADSGTKKFIKYIEPHIHLPRKITWGEDCFNLERSSPWLKNTRNPIT